MPLNKLNVNVPELRNRSSFPPNALLHRSYRVLSRAFSSFAQTRAQELSAHMVGNCGMTAMACGGFSDWCHRQIPCRQASWYSVYISEKLRAKSRLPSKRLPIKSWSSYSQLAVSKNILQPSPAVYTGYKMQYVRGC